MREIERVCACMVRACLIHAKDAWGWVCGAWGEGVIRPKHEGRSMHAMCVHACPALALTLRLARILKKNRSKPSVFIPLYSV